MVDACSVSMNWTMFEPLSRPAFISEVSARCSCVFSINSRAAGKLRQAELAKQFEATTGASGPLVRNAVSGPYRLSSDLPAVQAEFTSLCCQTFGDSRRSRFDPSEGPHPPIALQQ